MKEENDKENNKGKNGNEGERKVTYSYEHHKKVKEMKPFMREIIQEIRDHAWRFLNPDLAANQDKQMQ